MLCRGRAGGFTRAGGLQLERDCTPIQLESDLRELSGQIGRIRAVREAAGARRMLAIPACFRQQYEIRTRHGAGSLLVWCSYTVA
jgi:hypothetical protein